MTTETGNNAGAVPPASITWPGRYLGRASTATRDEGRPYIFIHDAKGTEYFSHKQGWRGGLWGTVEDQAVVSFMVSETEKGLRAWAIQPASPEELDRWAEQIEGRGNS